MNKADNVINISLWFFFFEEIFYLFLYFVSRIPAKVLLFI